MRKRIILLFTIVLFGLQASGQNVTIQGVVTDSITGERLAYASLLIEGTTIGSTTDEEGCFFFTTSEVNRTLQISYLGYTTKELKITQGKMQNLHIQLVPDDVVLTDVVVKPKRERYTKKDNPAVEFVRKVIDLRDSNTPYQHDYYSYDHYEKMIFAKNEYTYKTREDGKKSKFDFLMQYVDTLEGGITILPVSEKERMEKVLYRRDPKSEKRILQGYKSAGVDEIFSADGVQQFLNEVFHEVDIFQNNIPLFLQRFVSPLSTIGPNYYKYYLLDTVQVNGQPCADLGFVPFNSETFGFTGHLYVTLDSTYFVSKAVLNVPKDINLNFVSSLTIKQEFERSSDDSTRIVLKDDIAINFKLTERTKGLYARRLNIYTNHSFERPEEEDAFDKSAPLITQENAYQRDDEFWNSVRPLEAKPRNSNSVEKLMSQLDSIAIVRVVKEGLTILVSGYIRTNKDPNESKFEFGPMNSTFNSNKLEGARFRVGGTTTPHFNPNLFLGGYLAYGERDRKFKYDAAVEYSFNDRKEFLKEYPVHSLRFEYMYDVNKLGQYYMYTSKDNIMLMIRRKRDLFATYQRKAELSYYREHYNGWAYGVSLRNLREYATQYGIFNRINADGSFTSLDHYDMTTMEFKLRFARNEKFYQTRDTRIPITFDALIFNLSHMMAFKDVLGSSYTYHRTEVGAQKRFWFSAFGYLDVIAKAGKVWTKVPYPLLILPNANMTYTIQSETYTNMNALEFINDEYASWDVTYYMNGNLLNRLPLIKKLQWREVFCFRGLWGNLTDKNNPEKNGEGLFQFPSTTYEMSNTPYMEASVGIENIFKMIRIDYVWRLNYRDHPDIQVRGIRMTIRPSF